MAAKYNNPLNSQGPAVPPVMIDAYGKRKNGQQIGQQTGQPGSAGLPPSMAPINNMTIGSMAATPRTSLSDGAFPGEPRTTGGRMQPLMPPGLARLQELRKLLQMQGRRSTSMVRPGSGGTALTTGRAMLAGS